MLGMNCQPGAEAAVAFAERHRRATSQCPLLVKPSARRADGAGDDARPRSPPRSRDCSARNVRLIGGCCGTTELHVAALADACRRSIGILSRP